MPGKIKIMPVETRPQILISGNGIERGFGSDSWEEIIKRILKENDSVYMYNDIKDLPANMQIVIASANKVDVEMGKLKERLMAYPITEEHKKVYRRFGELGIDAVLSTNYDYNIEQSFGCPNSEYWFQRTRRWTKEVDAKSKKYHLFQYSEVDEVVIPPIWHIHGDICNKESMVMGHFYYGKLLSQIEKRGNEFVRWYKAAMGKNMEVYADSWVDLFLTGDLYIIGLEMYFTEVDLWWLLDYKYMVFPESRVYYYKPKGLVDNNIRKMLSIYPKVSIVEDIDLQPGQDDPSGYRGFYEKALDNIAQRVSERKTK